MLVRYPKYRDIELPLLKAIATRGGACFFSVDGEKIENEIADHFQLSEELRRLSLPTINAKGKRKWRNMIQYARRRLVKINYMDNSQYDLWRITPSGFELLRKLENFP